MGKEFHWRSNESSAVLIIFQLEALKEWYLCLAIELIVQLEIVEGIPKKQRIDQSHLDFNSSSASLLHTLLPTITLYLNIYSVTFLIELTLTFPTNNHPMKNSAFWSDLRTRRGNSNLLKLVAILRSAKDVRVEYHTTTCRTFHRSKLQFLCGKILIWERRRGWYCIRVTIAMDIEWEKKEVVVFMLVFLR